MSLTARSLTVWRKPWRGKARRAARQLIADQSPQPGQRSLALAAAAPSSAASPPGGCPAAPPEPRLARSAAPSSSIEQAGRHAMGVPGAAAIGDGE
jgi:hypothetical protein